MTHKKRKVKNTGIDEEVDTVNIKSSKKKLIKPDAVEQFDMLEDIKPKNKKINSETLKQIINKKLRHEDEDDMSEEEKHVMKKSKLSNESLEDDSTCEMDTEDNKEEGSEVVVEEVLAKVLDSTAQPRVRIVEGQLADDVVMSWADNNFKEDESDDTPRESRSK